jgi:hypothetical protein
MRLTLRKCRRREHEVAATSGDAAERRSRNRHGDSVRRRNRKAEEKQREQRRHRARGIQHLRAGRGGAVRERI